MSQVNLEQLQNDLTYRLDGAETLALINVKSLRKLVIASELDAKLIAITPKTGQTKIGAGVVVMMPELEVPNPDVPGPMLTVDVEIRCLENPTINQDAATGTAMTAEEVSVAVLQDLHQVGFEGLLTTFAARKAVTPFPNEEGLVVYGVHLTGTLPITPLVSVNLPTIDVQDVVTNPPPQNKWQVTLTDTTGGATIYYTVDGSYPGSKNAAAVPYAGSFQILKVPGTNVTFRWCAYKAGMRGSDVGQAILIP